MVNKKEHKWHLRKKRINLSPLSLHFARYSRHLFCCLAQKAAFADRNRLWEQNHVYACQLLNVFFIVFCLALDGLHLEI